MTEVSEFEKLQIGNCQIRLPTRICTDPSVFGSIFSIETWKNELDADQRERIMVIELKYFSDCIMTCYD